MTCNHLPPDSDIEGLDWALGADYASPPMPAQIGEAATPRKIRLTWSVSDYHFHKSDGIRVRIEATDSELMPTKVFAYLLLPAQADAEERTGAFDHVCSPSDLEEYPEDEPIPNVRPEWFRLNYIDVVLRSRAEVHAFIRDTAADVYTLKRTLDLADRLNPIGELWIGGGPSSSSSSSSSRSSSSSSSSSRSSSSSSSRSSSSSSSS